MAVFYISITIDKLNLPTVPPDTLTPSVGTKNVITHDDVFGGGTFDTFFDVFFDVIVTHAGGDPNDPSQAVENTSVNFGRLTNPLGTWSHSAPLDYPANPSFPPGDYYPMGLTSYAGHPGTIGDLGIT